MLGGKNAPGQSPECTERFLTGLPARFCPLSSPRVVPSGPSGVGGSLALSVSGLFSVGGGGKKNFFLSDA